MSVADAVAVIPARGGSKRLPRKNILPVLGRPLIGYTIEAARLSRAFRRVIVSTEDAEIAAVARAEGAEVMARAAELAGDNATMVQVCTDVLRRVAAEEGRMPAWFCCLLATSAQRDAADIIAVRDLVGPGGADFAMAVTDWPKPPTQALEPQADGSLALKWPALDLPGQRPPRLLVDAGSTYWCRSAAFLAARDFYGPGLRGFEVPRRRAVDVDTAEDLELLEMYMLKDRAAAAQAAP